MYTKHTQPPTRDSLSVTTLYYEKHLIIHKVVAAILSTGTKIYYFTCKGSEFKLIRTREVHVSPKKITASIRGSILHHHGNLLDGSTRIGSDNPKLDTFVTYPLHID